MLIRVFGSFRGSPCGKPRQKLLAAISRARFRGAVPVFKRVSKGVRGSLVWVEPCFNQQIIAATSTQGKGEMATCSTGDSKVSEGRSNCVRGILD